MVDHNGLQKLYNTHWNTNWSDLPSDVGKEVEQAFEHIQKAHDMMESR